jgi:hypothetical protein
MRPAGADFGTRMRGVAVRTPPGAAGGPDEVRARAATGPDLARAVSVQPPPSSARPRPGGYRAAGLPLRRPGAARARTVVRVLTPPPKPGPLGPPPPPHPHPPPPPPPPTPPPPPDACPHP